MSINKEAKTSGMPWEQEYGYSQSIRVGDTIYLAGQVSHDANGGFVGVGDMEAQMRQAYANVQKLLAEHGATMDDVVDEVVFVTDMQDAFEAATKCRKEIFSGQPVVASTIVEIKKLAFPELLIEIKCVAKV
jgi:enamine deaminase RidA (YjgF/YER057c/UK114 family)